MPADGSNVVTLPVRSSPRPEPLSYEIVPVQGSVKCVIGEVELWFSAEDAVEIGEALAGMGREAGR